MTSTKVIIREAQSEDAQDVLNYLKFITNETSNLLLTPEEMAQKEFTDEINLLEESSKSSANLFLLATKDEKIIGTANMKSFLRKRISHRGTFGISVLKEFSGQGIGSMLLAEIINYAKSINLEILELEVRTDNIPAIHLYKKLNLKNMDYMKIFLKLTINIVMGHLCY
ncbi:GNAT family N-acetyltransferase [Pediococcus pentosaceus]